MKNQELVEEWRTTYQTFCDSEFAEDAIFESFCIGWCMARGLTPDDGYEFYQNMIPLGLF